MQNKKRKFGPYFRVLIWGCYSMEPSGAAPMKKVRFVISFQNQVIFDWTFKNRSVSSNFSAGTVEKKRARPTDFSVPIIDASSCWSHRSMFQKGSGTCGCRMRIHQSGPASCPCPWRRRRVYCARTAHGGSRLSDAAAPPFVPCAVRSHRKRQSPNYCEINKNVP